MSESNAVVDLDREAIKQGLRDGTMVIVDVREPNEYAAGHIPGAVSNPLSTFDPTSLPGDKRIVFSCAAGVRSLKALALAQAYGLPINEHYKGGFKDWIMAGEPVDH